MGAASVKANEARGDDDDDDDDAVAATTTATARDGDDDAGDGRASSSSSSSSSSHATKDADGDKGDDEEEEETCGFCKYMKGGSCKEAFVAWEACVDKAKETDEDFVEVCYEVTSALRDCMLKDPEYYGPMTGETEDEEDAEGGKGDDAPAAAASED